MSEGLSLWHLCNFNKQKDLFWKRYWAWALNHSAATATAIYGPLLKVAYHIAILEKNLADVSRYWAGLSSARVAAVLVSAAIAFAIDIGSSSYSEIDRGSGIGNDSDSTLKI